MKDEEPEDNIIDEQLKLPIDEIKEEFEELIEELEKSPEKKLHTDLWILEQVKGLYHWNY